MQRHSRSFPTLAWLWLGFACEGSRPRRPVRPEPDGKSIRCIQAVMNTLSVLPEDFYQPIFEPPANRQRGLCAVTNIARTSRPQSIVASHAAWVLPVSSTYQPSGPDSTNCSAFRAIIARTLERTESLSVWPRYEESEHIDHWTKMLRPFVLFSGSEPSRHIRSSAGFIITMCVFEFSVHTRAGMSSFECRTRSSPPDLPDTVQTWRRCSFGSRP